MKKEKNVKIGKVFATVISLSVAIATRKKWMPYVKLMFDKLQCVYLLFIYFQDYIRLRRILICDSVASLSNLGPSAQINVLILTHSPFYNKIVPMGPDPFGIIFLSGSS